MVDDELGFVQVVVAGRVGPHEIDNHLLLQDRRPLRVIDRDTPRAGPVGGAKCGLAAADRGELTEREDTIALRVRAPESLGDGIADELAARDEAVTRAIRDEEEGVDVGETVPGGASGQPHRGDQRCCLETAGSAHGALQFRDFLVSRPA